MKSRRRIAGSLARDYADGGFYDRIQQEFAASEMGFNVLAQQQSASGQKWTLDRRLLMSALSPKADIG